MPNPYLDDDESFIDKTPDGPPRRVGASSFWVVHISHNATAIRRAKAEGFICVGWVEAGDLTQYSKEQMRAAFNRHYPAERPMTVANWVGDAQRFAFELDVGHLFVFPVTGKDEILIGEITGDYQFAADDSELVASDCASLRSVKWLMTVPRGAFSREAIKCFDSEHVVHSGQAYRDEVCKVVAARTSASAPSQTVR